jgi:TrmH family RNA methyltransferase
MQITSASNEKIKHARKVREGRDTSLIFIEGLRLAEEAVQSGLVIEIAFLEITEQPSPRLTSLCQNLKEAGIPLFEITSELIRSLGDTVQSQGIILLAKRPQKELSKLLETDKPLLLGLDRIQDPGNLGTLIRTAEAAGVCGIFSLKGSTDAFSPKVLRSAMGSAFRLPLIEKAQREDLLALQQNAGIKIVAAAGEGEMDYTDYNWKQPTLLLLGNEGQGVAPELMEQCDMRLRIPMHAGVESLNVAAAGAVMLFEAARQRRG